MSGIWREWRVELCTIVLLLYLYLMHEDFVKIIVKLTKMSKTTNCIRIRLSKVTLVTYVRNK